MCDILVSINGDNFGFVYDRQQTDLKVSGGKCQIISKVEEKMKLDLFA